MKVILAAIAISQGKQQELILGDLSTKIDQGSAWDYVEDMVILVSNAQQGDYILSSGEQHSIRDMLDIVFGYLGLDWEKYVRVDASITQRKIGTLFGDNAKIKKAIPIRPRLTFRKMLEQTIDLIQENNQ